MTKLPLLAGKLLDAKTKKLVKSGLLTENLEISCKGQRILDSILLVENIDKLVAWAETYLASKEAKDSEAEVE